MTRRVKHVLAAVVAAGLGMAANASAANFPPFSGNPITATIDGATNFGGDTWYQIGTDPAAPTTGIPKSGSTFNSQTTSTISYTMPVYSGNDALLLFGDGPGNTKALNGTLNFASPVSGASNLSILTASGNGKATVTVTGNLSGGGTVPLGTITSPDWFGNTPVAYTANGRASNGDGANGVPVKFDNVNSNNPRLYDETITIPAGTGALSGITVDVSGTGALQNTNTHPVFFAVSSSSDGKTYTPVALNTNSFNESVVVTTPEPASLGLLGMAGLGLIARRRRA